MSLFDDQAIKSLSSVRREFAQRLKRVKRTIENARTPWKREQSKLRAEVYQCAINVVETEIRKLGEG